MAQFSNATLLFYPKGDQRRRLVALWYFTTLMLAWILGFGHTVLGFEQSWAHPTVAVGTAIAMQMLLEAWPISSTSCQPPSFREWPCPCCSSRAKA
jgi:hypothetical protein